MARKAEQRCRQLHELHDRRRAWIEPSLADAAGEISRIRVWIESLGQAIDRVERVAECLADVAHRRARPIADDLGNDAGAVPAVLLVDVLKDLLAALMLEIDIDVGGLVPLAADEALEEQVGPIRID